MMIGTMIGARLLPRIKPKAARWSVIVLLFLTGGRYILKGFSIIG
jgi:uncharacterized membrane protein YfcA